MWQRLDLAPSIAYFLFPPGEAGRLSRPTLSGIGLPFSTFSQIFPVRSVRFGNGRFRPDGHMIGHVHLIGGPPCP